MKIIKTARASRISTILTSGSKEALDSVRTLSSLAPRTLVSSGSALFEKDGVRFVNSGKLSIKNLLATYVQEFRGNEIVALCNPDAPIFIADGLLTHVESSRMEMTWAAHLENKVFFMSANVVGYLMGEIPDGMMFSDDWQGWLHLWMQKSLRQRYFDATPFCRVSETVPDPVPEPKKIQVTRKIKR